MRELIDFMETLGISHSEDKSLVLKKYMEEILELNKSVNLTAITNTGEFIQKHYMDSISCAYSKEFAKANTVIDVGTGGGFPGIPLAVAFPEKKFVLMDSLAKRINIINNLCEKLCITNVTAIHGRAEELARKKDYRESFDLCVSRAVANMSTLSEYCLPFIKIGGNFISYKGDDCYDEVEAASKALKLLGGEILRIDSLDRFNLPFDHKIVYINKIKETPNTYPRKAGTPSKSPIK